MIRTMHQMGWALVIAASAAVALAQDPADKAPASKPAASVHAIIHATLHVGDGSIVPNATIILEKGRVKSVSKGGAVPSGADVYDAEGFMVTPGLVVVNEPVGIMEIELEPSTVDASRTDDPYGVHPSFSAVDGYNPGSSVIPVARLGGITSAVSIPDGGLVPGTSGWFDLAGTTPADTVGKDYAAVHVDLSRGAVRGSGGAMPAAMARLRELLDDAKLYGAQRAAFDRRAMRETHANRADLERMQDVLSGKLPLMVRVSRSVDILRVLELAKDYRLKLILLGVEEGWKVAGAIAAAKVPVFVQPLMNLPYNFDRIASRYDNASLLAKAGVTVSFVTGTEPYDARNLRQEVGNAVAWGFDTEAGLAAVTSNVAKAFGMDKDYGTVAPGKIANLVAWTGDPFEVSTWAKQVWVRGEPAPMRSRQTALFERYRTLPVPASGITRW